MKLHFEQEDLTGRQECSALTSNIEGTALNCVIAKKTIPAGHSRENLRNPVESFWMRGARTPNDDAFRETKQREATLHNANKTE